MHIGIIGAMEEEIRLSKETMGQYETTIIASFTFYTGELQGKRVTLVQSGIGKVNATLSVALLVERFNVDVVVNTGSAGGLGTGLHVGDVVIADDLLHHDVDVTAFGYQIGQMAGMPATYATDKNLADLAESVYVAKGLPVQRGLIVSGDVFVHSPTQIAQIKQSFPTALACEMESAAIAQAAYVLGVPCLVIRAISDSADDEAAVSFDEFIVLAGQKSAEMVLALLAQLA